MASPQPAVLQSVPPLARALTFRLRPDAAAKALAAQLAARDLGDEIVGFGLSLLHALASPIDGMRHLPVMSAPGIDIPSTPASLWVLLRGSDRGELLHRGRAWERELTPALELVDALDTFMYRDGRDLSGYVDGTENPTGEHAKRAALVSGRGPGLDGSSFVAVQRWRHDLARFESFSRAEQDDTIGRRLDDNAEFDAAPASAHVKRAAQESFEPEAFMFRHSMPWASADAEGLLFIAFGHSFDAFEAVLRRMIGIEDGIRDALFRFTRPMDGAYYWCPPSTAGKLDLSRVRTA
jgi:putative iron-dependent peroxidase